MRARRPDSGGPQAAARARSARWLLRSSPAARCSTATPVRGATQHGGTADEPTATSRAASATLTGEPRPRRARRRRARWSSNRGGPRDLGLLGRLPHLGRGRACRGPRQSRALRPGEVVGLAGESGSGKSTLAYGACRLLRAPAVITGGSVIYRGRRLPQAVDILSATKRGYELYAGERSQSSSRAL